MQFSGFKYIHVGAPVTTCICKGVVHLAKLYPLKNNSPSYIPPGPGNRLSTSCRRESGCSGCLMYEQPRSICPLVAGLPHLGLPWWLSWKRVCLRCGRPGIRSWVGRIPWTRAWQPTLLFWPGEFHDPCSPWGRRESDTAE